VFGGAIVGAYASYRFLAAKTDEERAHYDWMGYVGNFIAISALIVLPFAGYWLGREIYQYDQSMGITMMGGFMSWLWVIQAFLIAVLFLTGNYYLWVGMGRIPGAERFRPYTKWLLAVLVLGAIVWGTPHTMIADSRELAAMGGSHHPFLGALGVMSAKNTAVNLMILTTFLSFLLYRRANIRTVVPWARSGTLIQGGMFGVAAAIVLFFGIRGYFVEAIVRIGYSVYQVGAVLACIIFVTVIDVLMARGAQSLGAIQWGKMPPALAVRAVHPRGHVHVADGTDGLRAQRHSPALARVAGPSGQDAVRGDAGARAGGHHDQHLRPHLPVTRGFIFWLGGLAEKIDLRSGGAGREGGARMWGTNLRILGVVLGRWRSIRSSRQDPAGAIRGPARFDARCRCDARAARASRRAGLHTGIGGCTTCHGLGTRAPNLLTDEKGQGPIGARCGKREPGKDCKAYLHEALTQPGAFVVRGYEPIMPDMTRTLSPQQIWAVIAFLESQGGTITVSASDIPAGNPGGPTPGASPGIAGGSTDPMAIIRGAGCIGCHKVGARRWRGGARLDARGWTAQCRGDP